MAKVWHADGPASWAWGDYKVYAYAKFYSAWLVGRRHIGNSESLKEAQRLCEQDAQSSQN